MPKELPDKVHYSHFRDMFKCAGHGIFVCIREETNMKVHLIIALLVMILAWWLDFARMEWCMLLLCIGLVLALEMVNTAIENIVDFICPQYDPRAGKIKDVGSGLVLIFALFVAVIGCMLFIPHLMELR